MPGLDGTGPSGKGSLTGRGKGRCVKQNKKHKDQNPDSSDSSFRMRRRKFWRGWDRKEENSGRRRQGN